jgi:hypothetical protein
MTDRLDGTLTSFHARRAPAHLLAKYNVNSAWQPKIDDDYPA